MLTARADVGRSPLRPPALLEARAAHRRGEPTPAGFGALESLAEVSDLQDEAEVDVVTVSEMRRPSFGSEPPAQAVEA